MLNGNKQHWRIFMPANSSNTFVFIPRTFHRANDFDLILNITRPRTERKQHSAAKSEIALCEIIVYSHGVAIAPGTRGAGDEAGGTDRDIQNLGAAALLFLMEIL